jgi:putative ABC transport system permease protein
VLTGLIFGTAPALQLSRANPIRARGRVSGVLVVTQVALAVLLLIGAGLLVRSFTQLLRVNPGFDPQNVLTMNVSLPTAKYATGQQQTAFFDEVLRRVSALPGVRNAAISATLPLTFIRFTPVLPEGQPNLPLAQRPFLDIEAISPQWFRTMRVPLRAGREFSEIDNARAPKVVIADETFARRFWPGQNAVGKRVIVGRGPEPSEVVGIAADVRNRGLAQSPQAQLYLPFAQLPWGNMNLLVRTDVSPLSLTSAVRAQISAVDADEPVINIQTVDALMDNERAQPRFTMLLLGAFSATAFLLAAIGIYGVLGYSVAQRRRELGIRLALGAGRGDILGLVIRQGLTLAAAGILIGLAAAPFLTRLMSSMLFEVDARDLTTFILAPLVFLAAALISSYLPARRATQVDPMEALKWGSA